MPKPALLSLCSSSVAPIFGGCERLWPSNRKPRPLDGCPTFAPPAPACRGAYVGRKRRANRREAHQTISLSTKPLERISEKFPPKKNPEGYGLQPVRKCIHRGPALAAEGSMFPSIQRHHTKNRPHT
jgi:hypothetical protein